MAERGKYIVIEGHDGTGKSKQRERLASRIQAEKGVEVIHTFEPGGTPISDDIRVTIKNGELARDGLTNVLLFTASRRESWNQVIAPALNEGTWVISDRSWFSTMVYQGHGEGIDLDFIEQTTRDFVSPEYLRPDIAVILALKNEAERKRRAEQSADTAKDTFEQMDDGFQNRVTQGYLSVARRVGAIAIEFDVDDSVETVSELIWDTVKDRV
jgi:dTMP kinase